MNARPNAWLRQAENDLALAQLARDNGFLAQACFYSSQAAEKGLKSALLELGDEPPHTHVLNDLVGRLKQNGLDTRALDALPGARRAGDTRRASETARACESIPRESLSFCRPGFRYPLPCSRERWCARVVYVRPARPSCEFLA